MFQCNNEKNNYKQMKLINKLFFGLLFVFTVQSLVAEERILNFHSDIIIDNSGRINVTETIKVVAEGKEIKRGIYRKLPLKRVDKNKKKVSVNYNVLNVLRDGNSEEFSIRKEDKFLAIYIGNSEQNVSEGEHEYVINYESYGQIGFFDEYDELYWNVTGNEWVFPILNCSATIVIPDNAKPIQYACYTGSMGSTDKECDITEDNDKVFFRTTTILEPNKGFTVAAAFPMGIIKRPPPPSASEVFWDTFKNYFVGITGLLVCLIYFFVSWKRVGRDPEKQIVVPQFKAPNNWSPATLRYVYKRECDNVSFTAAIISMAVKKALKISYEEKKYSLSSINNSDKLAPEETAVYNALFEKKDTLKITDNEYSVLSTATGKLASSLGNQVRIKDYFSNNTKQKIIGICLALGFGLLYMFVAEIDVFEFFFPILFLVGGLGLMISSFKRKALKAILLFILGLILFFLGLLSNFIVFDIVSAIFVLLISVVLTIFLFLITAPTKLGAKTMADLEGFKMYLTTAEKNRLNGLVLPKQTPELFEELLPYAIALGVENAFSKNFDEVLQAANYNPDWYAGTSTFTSAAFGSSLANSFTSSVTTASSSSSGSDSWNSGSSGGGSSGGGGGGGGGGGW